MRDRKRIEEALGADRKIGALTDDLDTLFELAREGERVEPEILRELQYSIPARDSIPFV